jgi:hypothetical protein
LTRPTDHTNATIAEVSVRGTTSKWSFRRRGESRLIAR